MDQQISVLASDNLITVRSTINLIQTPVYLVDVDPGGSFTLFGVNESEERVMGFKQEEIAGRRLEDVLDPDFAARRLSALQRCAETRAVVEFENFVEQQDVRRWVNETLVPVFDRDARLMRVMGTARDVTDQKRTEQELRRTNQELREEIARHYEDEQRFERVFEEGPTGMALVDLNGRIIKSNQALCRMFGYTDAELAERKASDLSHPDEVEISARMTQQLFDGQIPTFRREKKYLRKDGSVLWALATGTLVRDESGQPLYALGMIEDITKRKSAEDTIRQTNEELEIQASLRHEHIQRFERVFEAGPIGMSLVGPDLKMSRVNDALCEITGYTKEELTGLGFDKITHPEDADIDVELAGQVFRGEIPFFQIEKRYIRKDGRIRWGHLTATMIRDESGAPLYGLGMVKDIHERKVAEAALRESQNKYQSLTEAAPVGIFQTDEKGRYIYVNERWTELAGMTLEQARGEGWTDALHPDDRDRVIAEANETMSTRGPFASEYRYRHTDGETTWVSGQAVAQLSEAGKSLGYIGTITDITEFKHIESKLEKSNKQTRLSENRFRTLLDSSPDGILVTGPDGNIELVNAQMEKMFGYERSELIGKSTETLVPIGSRDRHVAKRESYSEAPLLRTIGSGLRLCGRRKDGSEFPVEISLSPVEMEGRTVTMAAIRDVTEIREVIDARLRLASIVEASTDAIVQSGVDGAIVAWNTGAETMFGYSSEEIIGKPVTILLPPDLAEERAMIVDALGRDESVEIPETVRVGKDGKRVDVSASFFSLKDSEGKVTSTVGIARDIGPHKEMERQFREAQRMDAIGKLAGGIAHDFNNILTVISGYASLIKDQLADRPDLQRSLEAQSRATERGATLIRELLAFSRKQRFDSQVLDLNGVVSELRKVLLRAVGEDVELITGLGSKGHIEADPAQLEQVIVNLVINARHAMPQGGLLKLETSDVRLGEEEAAKLIDIETGPYVLLSVTDNGTGMDADTMTRIFEPFFSTKSKGEGTGLGLSAVYGIVKQSGGAIEVESEPGHGTVFRIFFPQAEPARDDSEAPKETTEEDRGDETIFLLEDDEDVRVLASEVLRHSGYTILEVGTVEEARGVLRTECSIDLVLTDVVMPDMSGPRFVDWVRANYRDVRVLYMSGYTDDALAARPVDKESHLLQKPFTPADLRRKVKQVLHGR